MPNDPDNRMDELLRAYAQKRRTDAGGSFELPPVARRLLKEEVSKLHPTKRQTRPSWFSHLLALWPRMAYAVGLFAVLALFVWFALPARHKNTGEQLLAKSSPSGVEHRALAPKSDATLSSAEVLPTDGKKDSNETGGSRSVALDALAERRQAGNEIRQPEEKTVLAAAEELKRKDAEKPVLESDAPRLSFQKAEATVALSAPPLAPAQPVPHRRVGADSSLSRSTPAPVAAGGAHAGNGPVVLRDSVSGPASASTSDQGDNLVAFFTLGTFTNSSAARAGREPQFQFANASQDFDRLQTDKLQLARGNVAVREGNLKSNGGVAGNVANSTNHLPQQGQASAFSENEAITKLQANQAAPRQSRAYSVGLADEQDVRGRFVQAGKPPVTSQAKGAPVALASVLNSFKLEQSGSRVRVLDFDGSVYEGMVLSTESISTDPSSRSPSAETAVGLSTRQANTSPLRSVAPSDKERPERESPEVKVLSFRVAGTNATFKLPVVLDGALWGKTAETPEAVSGQLRDSVEPGLGRLNEDGLRGNVPSVLRVTGRAQVGDTNQLSIDAIRSQK